MNDDRGSHLSRFIAGIFGMLFIVWFARQRKRQLGPRIIAFLQARGAASGDEIREHLGLGSMDGGDVQVVLDALLRDGTVATVAAPDAAGSTGMKYRLGR